MKPGDYRVQVESDKVMIKGRDTSVEAPARINTADKKYSVTSMRSSAAPGQDQLREIGFGGSKPASFSRVERTARADQNNELGSQA